MKKLTVDVDELLKIGNDIARGWGASCYDVEVDNDNQRFIFYCIEFGEKFISAITFDEYRSGAYKQYITN